jgi:hypothetical protein
MIGSYYRQWIIGGLIWAVFFFLSRNLFLGVSFLMLLFSLGGLFAAYLGALYAPWKTPWIIALVKVLKVVTLVGACVVFVSFVIIEFKITGKIIRREGYGYVTGNFFTVNRCRCKIKLFI